MPTLPETARTLMPPRWTTIVRNLPALAIGLGFALGLHFLFGSIDQPFYAKLTLDIGIAIVLAVSLNMVNGFTGQFSMGHAGFMAVGGYAAAAITYYASIRLFGAVDPFRGASPPGGLLSFQMGFGEGYGTASYYENHYDTESTTSFHDTLVTHPGQIRADLELIGFVDLWHTIRPSFDDGHPNWIYVKAYKPHA